MAHQLGREPIPWKPIDILAATGLAVGGFFALALPLMFAMETARLGEGTRLSPWILGLFYGMILLSVWVFGIRKYRARWQSLGFSLAGPRWSYALAALALLGSLAFSAAYFLAVDALGIGWLEPPEIPSEALGQGVERLLNSFAIVIWGPLVEEVYFRGFVFGGLLAPLGATRAALASAALFAAAHVTLGALIPVFVIGLLFAWLYLRTRSLLPPIAAHAAQNMLVIATSP